MAERKVTILYTGAAPAMFPPNILPGWGQGAPPMPPQPPTQNVAGQEPHPQQVPEGPAPPQAPPTPQAPQEQLGEAPQATAPPTSQPNGMGFPPFPPAFPSFMVPPPFAMATNGDNNPTYGDCPYVAIVTHLHYIVGQYLENIMSELTEEQLHDLEGMERANVEARITLLRNIQQLLDAAVLQMNQYTTIMATLR